MQGYRLLSFFSIKSRPYLASDFNSYIFLSFSFLLIYSLRISISFSESW
jgi:hypothetical protein